MENTELINSTEIIVESTELVTGTENEFESAELEDTEVEAATLEESGQESGSQQSISLEDVEVVMFDTLTEYFSVAPVQAIIVDVDDPGVNKPIEEFTLVEVCLVIIVLILLGRAILDIIGGKAWSK